MVELFYLEDYREAVAEAARRSRLVRVARHLTFDSFDWEKMPTLIVLDAANCIYIEPAPQPSG